MGFLFLRRLLPATLLLYIVIIYQLSHLSCDFCSSINEKHLIS